ncbi:nuclear transport factor 2 family protein [Mangrovivirga sp. M17]|uniref:Nuclear transport factor 2 family protein n=1 Tax=Mangrovivirga halotolerans TaxID=2993936 RepID=A0ABT3RNY7_9BACT|nr:nuclear transport factor 2 family protein [Mangrovivirga halotolerans]MCX2743325.1 nuclear transport factor 2 family protein [Mangrovivirga halotolerans]
MKLKDLVKQWFKKWETGDYLNLPITENFKHTSPIGTIDGKKDYLALVKENEDKFLGQTFDIHDIIVEKDKACARYTAKQGKEFSLDVSEWYYFKGNLIDKIIAYYHIGEIREDRKLENPKKSL